MSRGVRQRRAVAALVVRAGRKALAQNVTDRAAGLAYYAFLAIPAALLVVAGVFSLAAGPDTVPSVLERVEGVVPPEAIALLEDSLRQLSGNDSGGVALVAVGAALALWTLTGAMTGLMRALNELYGQKETRGFIAQRLTALVLLICMLGAFVLAFGLLVLGPYLSRWVGEAVGLERVVVWLWWTAEWPILIGGLLLFFAAVFQLGPDVERPRFRLLSLGTCLAALIWLVASSLFALYVSMFGSYEKSWGTLSAVIVMLTWLWLSALALLLGAKVDAEMERQPPVDWEQSAP